MNAYSYVRLSSKKQLSGSGALRQASKPESICQQNGWTFADKTFSDLGVSSFKGTNRLKGALSEFIKLFHAGKLLPDPILIIEQWDRFSRQDIDESEPAVLDLLKCGVAIHVAFSNKTFTKESTKSLADRIEILVAMKSAHDYSANLSKRTSHARQRKIKQAIDGQQVNLGSMAPSWVDWDDVKKQYVLNGRSTTVKRVFDLYTANETVCYIARTLNEDGIPSFRGNKWQRASIRSILSSKTAVGYFKDRPGVFPPIVTEDQYNTVIRLLELHKNRRGARADLINIFRGIIFCSKCGMGVQMSKNKGRQYAYYRCPGIRLGCCDQVHGYRVDLLEEDLFGIVLGKDPSELIVNDSINLAATIADLQSKRDKISSRISKLLAVAEDVEIDDLKQQLTTLKNERNEVDVEINKTKSKITTDNSLDGLFKVKEFISDGDLDDYNGKIIGSLANLDIRKKIQSVIPTFIKSVSLDGNASKFTVEFHGGRTVTQTSYR